MIPFSVRENKCGECGKPRPKTVTFACAECGRETEATYRDFDSRYRASKTKKFFCTHECYGRSKEKKRGAE